MYEALTSHSAPCTCAERDALGSGAAPEEHRFFVHEGRIGKFGSRSIDSFVFIIPCGRVKDIVEAVCFALTEDGHEFTRCFECGGE